jgi:hypothetical protein
MTGNAELSMQVAKAFREIAVKSPAMDAGEILSALSKAETTLAELHAGQPALELEMRRRAAEWRLSLLGAKLPFEKLEELHRDLRKLGFSNSTKETTMEIVFARICASHNRVESARSILAQLAEKLVRNGKMNSETRELLAAVQKLQSELAS